MRTLPPLLFALQGSELYAARVAQRLGCSLAQHEERDSTALIATCLAENGAFDRSDPGCR